MDATLLIADTDARWRDAFQRFFSECGFEVEAACDGLDCLSKLRTVEPDVLVAELEMPWGGADGVVAMLREDHFDFDMPAVIIVGSAPPNVLCERTGVRSGWCYQKPVPMERLLDGICLATGLGDPRRAEPMVDG